METLLEVYKRRLKTVTELIEKHRSNGSIVHQRREERLNTKAAEYRAFIVEIERAMARKQPAENANCAMFDAYCDYCEETTQHRIIHACQKCSKNI